MGMEIALTIGLAVVAFGMAAVLYVVTQKLNELKNTSAVEMVKGDVV